MVLRRCRTWGGVVLLIAPLLVATAPVATGQDGAADIGRTIYQRECASCHGEAASGYGPAWSLLRQAPPDLTTLSRRDRPFERERIRSLVTGHIRRVPPQWPSEMPYWRHAPAADIDALLTFLESVQLQPYGPFKGITIADQARMGAPLFAADCVTCHGADGRGPQPGGYLLGVAVPDLTVIAARNGGTLDMRRLYEAIARCGSDERSMPSWLRVFRKRGWPAYLAMKNIENLAWHVESLQRR